MNSKRPSIPHPIPDRLLDLIAYRFRLLSEPARLKLLDQLRDNPLTAKELCEATGVPQRDVSAHLGTLVQAGVVDQRKDGEALRYHVTDPSIFNLCEEVCDGMRQQLGELDVLLEGPTPAQ